MIRKMAMILAVLLVLLISAGVFSQRQALACQVLPLLGFQQLRDQVFVANDIDSENFNGLSHLIDSAFERISETYGRPGSAPIMLITSDTDIASDWGANETASMHRLPWGACIVIGPKGQNVDVIAHEWLHAEVQYRVGFWRFAQQIPVWFDEGVALTVDYRQPFLPENIALSDNTLNAVQLLDSGREFFSGDVRAHYQAARMAVMPLLRAEDFYTDLERVAEGEPFDMVFSQRITQ
jgi:hypothetical protein